MPAAESAAITTKIILYITLQMRIIPFLWQVNHSEKIVVTKFDVSKDRTYYGALKKRLRLPSPLKIINFQEDLAFSHYYIYKLPVYFF